MSGRQQGDNLAVLFAEELGLVIEVSQEKEAEVLQAYTSVGLRASKIGCVTNEPTISIAVDSAPSISGISAHWLFCVLTWAYTALHVFRKGHPLSAGHPAWASTLHGDILQESCTLVIPRQWSCAGRTAELRDVWEATGFQLERLQAAVECVEAEQKGLASRQTPEWAIPFRPRWTPNEQLISSSKPQVAIIRCAEYLAVYLHPALKQLLPELQHQLHFSKLLFRLALLTCLSRSIPWYWIYKNRVVLIRVDCRSTDARVIVSRVST